MKIGWRPLGGTDFLVDSNRAEANGMKPKLHEWSCKFFRSVLINEAMQLLSYSENGRREKYAEQKTYNRMQQVLIRKIKYHMRDFASDDSTKAG